MSEQILAALTADERAILAPHVDRALAAEREMDEARRVLHLAALRLFPAMAEPGVTLDTERGVLWREAREEVDDAA